MLKLISKTIAAVAIVSVALLGAANAKTLKIETHFTASSPNGEVAAQFAKNVEMFSGGSLKVEMFYSSSVTGKSADVFNNEPNLDKRYLKLDNCFVLPHIGSATHETRLAMSMMAVDNIYCYFNKKPLISEVV